MDDSELKQSDFEQVGVNELIANSPLKTCIAYSSLFAKRVSELETQGPPSVARAATLLRNATLLYLQAGDKKQPFREYTGESPLFLPRIHDFTEPVVALLGQLLNSISDSEFQARLADICWLRMKSRQFDKVTVAIRGYLASATNLFEPGKGESSTDTLHRWEESALRLERATQLATQTNQLVDDVKAKLEEFLGTVAPNVPLLELSQIFQLYQESFGESSTLVPTLADQLIKRAAQKKQWELQRRFLEGKARWQHKAKLEAAARLTMFQKADSYLEEAKAAIEGPQRSHSLAASKVIKAIEAHTKLQTLKKHLNKLRLLLGKYQRASLAEMSTETFEIPTGIDPQEAAKAVKGFPFAEALYKLATIIPPLDLDKHKVSVMENLRANPFYALIGENLLDDDGKVIATRGSYFHADEESGKQILRAEMFKQAKQRHELAVQGFIEPARRQIILEHNVRLQDWISVVTDNPFIENGREPFFLRGLHEGMMGDFVLAAHFLIPQLEHAIRYRLRRLPTPITMIERGGTEKLADLNWLFNNKVAELEQIFGVSQVFELEGLLIRRYGGNLRNEFAHGKMWLQDFYSPASIYLWWLTLRLCLRHSPLMRTLSKPKSAKKSSAPKSKQRKPKAAKAKRTRKRK